MFGMTLTLAWVILFLPPAINTPDPLPRLQESSAVLDPLTTGLETSLGSMSSEFAFDLSVVTFDEGRSIGHTPRKPSLLLPELERFARGEKDRVTLEALSIGQDLPGRLTRGTYLTEVVRSNGKPQVLILDLAGNVIDRVSASLLPKTNEFRYHVTILRGVGIQQMTVTTTHCFTVTIGIIKYEWHRKAEV